MTTLISGRRPIILIFCDASNEQLGILEQQEEGIPAVRAGHDGRWAGTRHRHGESRITSQPRSGLIFRRDGIGVFSRLRMFNFSVAGSEDVGEEEILSIFTVGRKLRRFTFRTLLSASVLHTT